jgi:PBP1b-binding outer membrane lipoprotein LpoB
MAMLKARSFALPALLATSLLLGGCSAAEGNFPSLSKRPYETNEPIKEPDAAAEALTTALSADLQAKVNALLARHQKANAAYQALLPATRQTANAASGAASGSEGWANANVQLSRLDAARADSIAALGEMDALLAAENDKGADAGLRALLETPQSAIAAGVVAQTEEIERMARLIGA